MGLSFPKLDQVLLPIHGSGNFYPVNQIYCVGRNYRAHAQEMGSNDQKPPFFFTKPNWTITTDNVKYPINTKDLQHEVELVVALGEDNSIFGFAIGVDLTRRDIQRKAKENGKPWFSGKSFVGSAPISDIIPIRDSEELLDLELRLKVNGELRQSGSSSDMIWTPQEIIREMATEIPLSHGDLIFTGTPAGVGPIYTGDIIEASIPNRIELYFRIT